MVYVRKQFGNTVVVLHTNDISVDELFGLCVLQVRNYMRQKFLR